MEGQVTRELVETGRHSFSTLCAHIYYGQPVKVLDCQVHELNRQTKSNDRCSELTNLNVSRATTRDGGDYRHCEGNVDVCKLLASFLGHRLILNTKGFVNL
jgi:poly(3-hydroxybutyrate) depolymerase